MSSMAETQSGMLRLIGREETAGTSGLARVPGLASWWCGGHLRREYPLTTGLLKRLGLLDAAVAAWVRETAGATAPDLAGSRFLSRMSMHEDWLVASVARHEAALIAVREGSPRSYSVKWDRSPSAVLRALQTGGALPAPEGGTRYLTEVSRHIEGCVSSMRIADAGVDPWPDEMD